MFHRSQKSISPVKVDNLVVRNELKSEERTQRIQGAGFLQENMSPAMNELKCLDDEFNFANSAAAELQIAINCIRPRHIAFDSSLDARDLVQQSRRWAPRINKGLMLTKKFV